MIGAINFGVTETHGSAAGWMKREIEAAASKARRITVVRETLKTVKTEVRTRGLALKKKSNASSKQKYTISGTYLENKAKGVVTLILSLEIFDGEKTEVFATETATIPISEFTDNGLSLYPPNISQVENIEKDFDASGAMLEKEDSSIQANEEVANSEVKDNQTSNTESAEKSNVDSSASLSTAEKTEISNTKMNETVRITAYMLDRQNNVVDTLRPGDAVKFMIGVDKDVYIKIMGIDANGNTFWLPTKDDFIKANTVREFPDDNTVDYQVVDGVFGAEHLFIYASTSKEGLPTETGEAKYHPALISNTTRGITAVKRQQNLITGVFKIAYTVVP